MLSGLAAVLRKEALHMLRDKGTLRFSLVLPVFQLLVFGFIDTNVHFVPTVVFDQSRSRESREIVRALESTGYFQVVSHAASREGLHDAIVAGRAQVGVEIPPDWARDRLAGRTASFLVLVDGSDSTVATQAVFAAGGLALERSLRETSQRAGIEGVPLDVRPQLLFNPDARSANLLIPGLVAILLTFSGTLLAAYAIVRERERGTLEQLMVTPVSPVAVTIGKLVPYLALGFAQVVLVLTLMVLAFRVPIHGSLVLLLSLSVVYLLALLSLGLLVSSLAKTQMEATQIAQMFLLPSIMLSGYIFPLYALPGPLRGIAQVLPATHFIAISRGIIIRGATLADLWPHVLALLLIATVLVAASTRAFRRTIA